LDLDGATVAVRFSETPRAMRPFLLEVDAPDAASVKADFSMVGMDMVRNRYDLLRTPEGRWRAQVVLPVCVSGRQDWILTLTVNDRSASAPFSATR
jgi:hypothetical protein